MRNRIPVIRRKHREEFYKIENVDKRKSKTKCEKRGHHRYPVKQKENHIQFCKDCGFQKPFKKQ